MNRSNHSKYFDKLALGADSNLATTREITVGPLGYVALQVLIDNGAGGAPTDAPQGAFELLCSGDGERYTKIDYTELTDELARVAPNGNAVVDAWAIIEDVPGSVAKLRYKRTSGGGTDARATINLSSW